MGLIPSDSTITVETRFFPPLVVDVSAAAKSEPGLGGVVTRALKPRITLGVQGATLARVAPYGDPTPSAWPTVRIVLVVAGALAVFSVLRILRL